MAPNQAEIARELKLHRSMVSRYVKGGMPLTSRRDALGCVQKYVSSHGGGWPARGKCNTADVAAEALDGTAALDFRFCEYSESGH